ncbi:hypothetical protein J3Q64DRAFT_1837475 [Phycomyces blakesleeanus]|uniref:Uncharacterized protein n=2 Tax=Phycomyces blakesleeanus TaxID=4837 RepID=A0A167JWA8_PHYB8|nr:hypothetical protein PHYBLDRAFT_79763 [Phycomyces blakesleeanus NRRL 1555(-)]OAD66808.1 hypothetical protein PHYBLDRAFT_79763 [Phycomyces blakesleeanus NRRL 1555(-)]|eukprot:XP_018284848.1 hypothetical protein PHYBLDRAFT_79763 [Phycomyces blakesleeanus NRRL 1555(-)]
MASQVAGYQIHASNLLDLSLEEALANAMHAGSLLSAIVQALNHKELETNESAKDAYAECRKLRDYLAEQLWTVSDTDGVASIQAALDALTETVDDYEQKQSGYFKETIF